MPPKRTNPSRTDRSDRPPATRRARPRTRFLPWLRTRAASGIGGLARRESLVSYATIGILALLTYAPFLPQLGFFRDDWYILWAGETLGPAALVKMFTIDRPFVGLVYSAAYSLFRTDALAWQFFSFGLRLAGALAFLWMLRRILPQHPLAATSAAALFVLYPGFLQWPNGMDYFQHALAASSGVASLALTVAALQSRTRGARVGFTVASMGTALLCLLMREYMVGYEGFRVGLIWFLSRGTEGRTNVGVRRVLARWAPYLLLVLAFSIWRLAVFQGGRPSTDVPNLLAPYLARPLTALAKGSLVAIQDTIETAVMAWVVPLYGFLLAAEARSILMSLALAAAAVGIMAGYASVSARTRSPRAESPSWAGPLAAVAAVAIVVAVLPPAFSGRDVHWHSGFDRFTLHASAAVGLGVVAAAYAWLRPRVRVPVLLALIGLSVVTQFHNGTHWTRFWEAERQIWWQLSWRAPQLEPGTVLLVDSPVDGYIEDYEAWGPSNLIYYPESPTVRVTSEVLSERVVAKLQFGDRDQRGMRELIGFSRDYTHALVLSLTSTNSCLHVLDSRRLEVPEGAESLVRLVARYSKIGQVRTDDTMHIPSSALFGPEPARGWCFYYQQASLARQRGDWSEIVRLGDEAQDRGLKPADRTEWMPFLEGYVYAGDVERAREIALLIRDIESIRHTQCDSLSNNPLPGTTPDQFQTMITLLCEFS
ncbi:MAG: hypothetical protein WD040_08985 [Anaerolineales bacterium]